MDQERIRRLRGALRSARLDALILRLPENLVMACGHWPMNGFSHALVTAEAGPVALIAPSCEDEETAGCWCPDIRFFIWPRLGMPDPERAVADHLRELITRHGLARARIGIEMSFEWVAPPHNAGEVHVPTPGSIARLKGLAPKARWSDATALLDRLRSRKTDVEIARLRTAHRIAAAGHRALRAMITPGLSEAALAAEVYRACLIDGAGRRGVRHVNVFPQISSGRRAGGGNAHRAWRPIVSTGRRRLAEGDLAVLELAVCADGFWSDTTRVAVAGRASPIQRRAFRAVAAAQAAAIAAIRPGLGASVPDEITSRILIEHGFAEQIVHLTGHGVGFRYHEPTPFLIRGSRERLVQGNVMSVEPGLYDPAWGGIRIEDNIVVTADGCENLTPSSRRL